MVLYLIDYLKALYFMIWMLYYLRIFEYRLDLVLRYLRVDIQRSYISYFSISLFSIIE